jgi:plasmid stabilization system protein ParE
MIWATTPEADADLIRGREWIEADNAEAAQQFLRTARECFDRLGEFPELGPLARIKGREFEGVRFCLVSPPFNKWLIFYQVKATVEIIRVLYGVQNWRAEPKRFF